MKNPCKTNGLNLAQRIEKTGVERRAWLSPNALAAVQAVEWPLLTRQGNSWAKDSTANPISAEFRKLARPLGITLGFYALRHTMQTIGDRAKDPVATSYIMGHIIRGMSGAYREGLSLNHCGRSYSLICHWSQNLRIVLDDIDSCSPWMPDWFIAYTNTI